MADQKIYYLLKDHKLEKYYSKILEKGVKNEQGFLDNITEENMEEMGLSQVDKKQFSKLKEFIRRLGIASKEKRNQQAFKVFYTTPRSQAYKELTGMDSEQNTVEDLMLRICHEERDGRGMGVCLFTGEGMPLTDDPFFNTWSLKNRHIESGSKLYAIFTPKENLRESPHCQTQKDVSNEGPNTIRCHIMLKGNYDINVDLEQNTLTVLRTRLSAESGIPAHVLYLKDVNNSNYSKTLSNLGISEDDPVHFTLSSFHNSVTAFPEIFHNDLKPSVPQTQKGLSIFFSTLRSIVSFYIHTVI
ncbi:uncharacterized protein LOC107197390 [Astyanax mexicanus]|uniref:uncharacterized protein LOC107197390 n=1 Tax=Astyanax mexicanus TaxID=7994 RepID=UPI0020CAD3C9|nr:uncharacterized protein LOC107197390 [Astyanax mexicanus]XP_049328917.1 uncharacterized protein LOC107197390 [Astyanax mexicanus]